MLAQRPISPVPPTNEAKSIDRRPWRAAIRSMQPRGEGAIVATASLAGIVPFPPDPVYDASKHAVVGLIRSVAPTLEPLGM